MTPNYIFIVAGTRAEFERYLFEKYCTGQQAENYVYVDGVHVFRGRSEVHGFFIGTYEKRADIFEIKEIIRIINSRTPAPSIRGTSFQGMIVDELQSINV